MHFELLQCILNLCERWEGIGQSPLLQEAVCWGIFMDIFSEVSMPHFFFYVLFLSCNGFTVFLEKAQLSFSLMFSQATFLKDAKTVLILQMLLRASCFICLPIYYHQVHWEERKSTNPFFIPVAMALSKVKEKSRTLNEAKCSLAQECGGSLTTSELCSYIFSVLLFLKWF